MNERHEFSLNDENQNKTEKEWTPKEHLSISGLAVVRSDFCRLDSDVVPSDIFQHKETQIESTGARPWRIIEPAEGVSWRKVLESIPEARYLVHELSISVDEPLTLELVKVLRETIRTCDTNDDLTIYKTGELLAVASNREHVRVPALTYMLESLEDTINQRNNPSLPGDESWYRPMR